VIDLGGEAIDIDLGVITGDGELIFNNWTEDTVVNYDSSSSVDASSQIIFEGAGTLADGGAAIPTPEPGTGMLSILLATLGFAWFRHR